MRRPASRIGARLAQHPFPDRHDQAGLLRDRNELGRGYDSTDGVMPADELFHADDLVALEIDKGLIHDIKLAVAQHASKLDLHLTLRHDGVVDLLIEETIGTDGFGSRTVQRD